MPPKKQKKALDQGEGQQVGQVWLSAPSASYAYYRLTFTDEYGAQKRTSAGKSYDKAVERAKQVDAALTAGTAVRSSSLTFGQAWEQWVEEKSPTISLEYQAQLRRALRTKLAPVASTRLSDLRNSHLQRLLNDVTEAGGTAKTQKRLVSQVSPFLKWAYQEKLLPRSQREYLERLAFSEPAQYVKQDNQRGGLVLPEDVFSVQEVQRLADAAYAAAATKNQAAGKRWDYQTFARATHLAILLQANTGLRQGELRAIERQDFKADLSAGQQPFSEFSNLAVTRQYREHAGGFKEIRRPKGGKPRTIYVPAWTAATDENGTPRRSDAILREYDLDPLTTGTEEALRAGKARTLNRITIEHGYLVDLRTIRHQEPTHSARFWRLPDPYRPQGTKTPEQALHEANRLLYRQADGSLTLTTGEHLSSVRGVPRELQTQSFLALWDDGGILPLRELLHAHFAALEATTWDFWPDSFKEEHPVGGPETLLLWASIRPPRSNTRIPVGMKYLNPNGAHLSYNFGRTFWAALLEEAKVENPKKDNGQARSMRNLRHTFATQALRTGTPVNVVAGQLGHADPSITLQRYTKMMTPGAATPITL